MSVSRTKPPRKARAKRETAAPPSAAPDDRIASDYASSIARAILAAADSLDLTGCGTGRRRLINHLRGNQLPLEPDGPGSGFGVLEAHGAGWIEEVVNRLDEEGLLTVVVLPRGGAIVSLAMAGKEALDEGLPIPTGILPHRPRLGAHPETEGRLRELRRRIAAEEGRPAFSVFPNAVLAALAERRPGNMAELAEVPGLGAPRIAKYGRRILAALRKE